MESISDGPKNIHDRPPRLAAAFRLFLALIMDGEGAGHGRAAAERRGGGAERESRRMPQRLQGRGPDVALRHLPLERVEMPLLLRRHVADNRGVAPGIRTAAEHRELSLIDSPGPVLAGIIAGSILVFIPSLGAFIAPDLLGGGRRLMIGSLIHMQFSSSRNWPFGSAVAMILLAVVLVLMLVYARNAGRGRGEAAR